MHATLCQQYYPLKCLESTTETRIRKNMCLRHVLCRQLEKHFHSQSIDALSSIERRFKFFPCVCIPPIRDQNFAEDVLISKAISKSLNMICTADQKDMAEQVGTDFIEPEILSDVKIPS